MSISRNLVKQMDAAFDKYYGPKTPYWKYYLRSALDLIGFRQPVEYYNSSKRLEFECQTLQLWGSYSLNSPKVLYKNKSTLGLSIIDGQTLSALFEKSIDLGVVAILFNELNDRHQLAFERDEPRLCHVDANLGNILYVDHKVFHVDFEMGREYESTDMWAQREVTKLLISLSQAQEVTSMQQILSLFFSIYVNTKIVRQFVDNKLGGKSEKVIHNKINKNGYTLINLAVDMNNYLANKHNE